MSLALKPQDYDVLTVAPCLKLPTVTGTSGVISTCLIHPILCALHENFRFIDVLTAAPCLRLSCVAGTSGVLSTLHVRACVLSDLQDTDVRSQCKEHAWRVLDIVWQSALMFCSCFADSHREEAPRAHFISMRLTLVSC